MPTEKSGHGGHHLPERLRQYLHPSGRKIHIAPSPDAADTLRKQLSQDHGDDTFDVHIHGSPEHLDTLRQLREHHEGRRDSLRQQHGPVFDQFENVRRELDTLAADLQATSSRPVALDANFDRFGYSAHIRTHEVQASGTSTPAGDRALSTAPEAAGAGAGAGDDAEARDRGSAQTVKIWKRPVVRQYYHKGFIWRSSASFAQQPFELFIDLLYVGIIGILGDAAAENPTGRGLLEFAVLFILAYKLWLDTTLIVAWFDTGDLSQRVSIMFFMACLIGYTINIEDAFHETYTELIAFYLANRLFEAIYYCFIAVLIPMVRGMMVSAAVLVVIPAALWIGSIHVEEPNRWALIWIALFLDLFGMGVIIPFVRWSQNMERSPVAFLARRLQFYPAVNIEHKTERMGAFVTLVFGASVLALIFQSAQPMGISAYFGKAVLGLVIAFSFNMLYFEIDAQNLHTHAIRRSATAFFFWQNLHLPFILGFVLAAGALAKIVVVRDCDNADLELLTHGSQLKSEPELPVGLRWFFCAGLGAALACMGGIALTHDHKDTAGQRLGKVPRLVVRFAVAVVLICLPLAESLHSLQLIATVACLVVAVLFVDLLGSTARGESVWRDRSRCEYAADCKLKRKDIEELADGGGTLRDLAAKDIGEKGGATVS